MWQEQRLKDTADTVLLLDDYLVRLQGHPDNVILVIWRNVENLIAFGAVLLTEVDSHPAIETVGLI